MNATKWFSLSVAITFAGVGTIRDLIKDLKTGNVFNEGFDDKKFYACAHNYVHFK